MSRIGNGKEHTIASAFVFLLLGMFAIFATLMVALSASMYRETVSDTDQHNRSRVLTGYVMNTIHANDAEDSVSITDENGTHVLHLAWRDANGDISYETRIYLWEGALREALADPADEFVPEYGEAVCAASAFSLQLENGMLNVSYADENGTEGVLTIGLYAAGKEAQP